MRVKYWSIFPNQFFHDELCTPSLPPLMLQDQTLQNRENGNAVLCGDFEIPVTCCNLEIPTSFRRAKSRNVDGRVQALPTALSLWSPEVHHRKHSCGDTKMRMKLVGQDPLTSSHTHLDHISHTRPDNFPGDANLPGGV